MPPIAMILKGTGAVLMLHAAYSCMHYRSMLQDLDLLSSSDTTTTTTNDDTTTTTSVNDSSTTTMMIPPVDVYIEVALAFFLILAGVLMGTGLLQSVELFNSNSKHKSLAAPAYRTRDFDIYTNRSKAMSHRKMK
mmetsp:Transcript_27006/g.29095  ORF Transcript_27006/g.29095 Transcript_27006/m.29095 type:complete len:135 (-) Transcript_27006:75-479(-)